MKRKRTAHKPKALRDSLDKRIAAACTRPDNDNLAINNKLAVLFFDYDPGRPHTDVENLVFRFKYLHGLQEVRMKHREARAVTTKGHDAEAAGLEKACREAWKLAKADATSFVLLALLGNRPEMLEALAREMKRKAAPKDRDALKARSELILADEESDPPNFTAIARKLTADKCTAPAKPGSLAALQRQDERTEMVSAKARSLRRLAHRIGVKTRAAGRPKKSDT